MNTEEQPIPSFRVDDGIINLSDKLSDKIPIKHCNIVVPAAIICLQLKIIKPVNACELNYLSSSGSLLYLHYLTLRGCYSPGTVCVVEITVRMQGGSLD